MAGADDPSNGSQDDIDNSDKDQSKLKSAEVSPLPERLRIKSTILQAVIVDVFDMRPPITNSVVLLRPFKAP